MCPFKELATAIAKIQDCLSDLDNNKLKLNKEKTEVFYLYSKHSPIKSLPHFALEMINSPIQFCQNIGVIFDSTMSMLPHFNCL